MRAEWSGCGDEIYLLTSGLSHDEFDSLVEKHYFGVLANIDRYKDVTITTACIDISGTELKLFLIGMDGDCESDPMIEPVSFVTTYLKDKNVILAVDNELHILENGKTSFHFFAVALDEKEQYYYINKEICEAGAVPADADFFTDYEGDGEMCVYISPVTTLLNYRYKNSHKHLFDYFGRSEVSVVVKNGKKSSEESLPEEDAKKILYWRFTETLWEVQ